MRMLFEAAERENITVEYCRLPLNKSMSAHDEAGDFILMDYSTMETGAEERTFFAHELGHCLTGSFYNPYSPYDIRGKHERRANKRAVYLLVPLDELITAVERGASGVWELSEIFDVTEDFMRKALEVYEWELRALREE